MSCAPPSMFREAFPLTTATPRGLQNLHRRGQQLLSKEKETLSGSWQWMDGARKRNWHTICYSALGKDLVHRHKWQYRNREICPMTFSKEENRERKGEGSRARKEGEKIDQHRPIHWELRSEVQLVKTDAFFSFFSFFFFSFFWWNGLKVIIVKTVTPVLADSGTRLELQPIIDSALWQYYKLSS